MKTKYFFFTIALLFYASHIIAQNGEVGIGTTDPDAKLHVENGTFMVKGDEGTTPVAGPGIRLMWIPEKRAFRAGEVLGDQWNNSSIGPRSFVGGGLNNIASRDGSFVGGGGNNIASEFASFIGGGEQNLASGRSSFIGGGASNSASEDNDFVGGGEFNMASGGGSFVGGGSDNTASGSASFIGGGTGNSATSLYSFVGGGSANAASGNFSFIGGGANLRAKSFAEAVFGSFSLDYTPFSTTGFNLADRLFVIGNGTNVSNRSNALTIWKDGRAAFGNFEDFSFNPPNDALSLRGGHVYVQNNYGVLSENQTGTSFGAGFDTTPSDDLQLYAGSTSQITLKANGDVSFGAGVSPKFALGYKVSIHGKVACEEVMVDLKGDWPDYVFKEDYPLKTLDEVKAHIEEKGHLPGVPSAKEVKETGVVLGEMNKVLMEKVEELTLYILQQEERIKALEAALEK